MENSNRHIPSSFTDKSVTRTGPKQQLGHEKLIAHTDRLEQQLWEVTDDVWCLVGNGLSNQTFVRGPKGIIAIDTGECYEEMAAALKLLREKTDEPIAGIIYTHFHYVDGTRAILENQETSDIPIWGHAKIEQNRRKYGMEVSAVAARGLVYQFGMALPKDGPDSIINAGLGLAFRNSDHAPYSPAFVKPTNTFTESQQIELAGLQAQLTPAPSDADDSITIWFPEL